jgi:hypothetical protein
MTAFVGTLLAIAIPGWRLLARRAWCAEQRSRLRARDPKVIWVNDGEKVPWALWGADHGFFEVEWAHRMPYLRAEAAVE